MRATSALLLLLVQLVGEIAAFNGRIWEAGAQTSPTRGLIVSIDNRELSWDVKDPHYPTQTSVINRDYAVHQQYDFLYIKNDVETLIPRIKAKYPNAVEDDMMKSEQVAKDVATGFNVHLQQYRAASWAKLPALWNITVTFKGKYDYIWYIDSDAAVSPWQFNRSIAQAIHEWASTPNSVIRGQPDLLNSTFIFFSNFPWRDNMPCAGSFIFRPSDLAEKVFRQWWDYDLAVKNFKHFHEQDALWHMIENPQHNFLLRSDMFSVVRERQFPSAFTRYEQLWLIHLASYNYAYRVPVFQQLLRLIKRNLNGDTYQDAVDLITTYHLYSIDPLAVAEAMEAVYTATAAPRIEKWPAHDVKHQSEWYDEHVSSRSMTPPPLGEQWEGRLVRFKREFFFVDQGQKRGFANYDALLQLKLGDDFAHSLSRHEVANLPNGPVIAEGLSASEKMHLLRYYLPLTHVNTHYTGHYASLVNEFHYRFDKKLHKQMASPSAGTPHRECIMDSELMTLMATGRDTSPTTSSPSPSLPSSLPGSANLETPSPRVLMFIIGHNSEAINIAKNYASCKEDRIRVVSIPSTPFFESIVYADLLPALLNATAPSGSSSSSSSPSASSLDYVILGTYKTVGKSLSYNAYTQSLTNVRVLLRHAYRHPEYAVVPFLRSGSACMPFAEYFHGPAFRQAWEGLLQALGESRATISAFAQSKQVFFRNVFIIRPAVLRDLCVFMQRAMQAVQQQPALQRLFGVDSRYREGDTAVARKVFGTDYYQLHPFVFERLPAYYMHSRGLSVCQTDRGPCKYNS